MNTSRKLFSILLILCSVFLLTLVHTPSTVSADAQISSYDRFENADLEDYLEYKYQIERIDSDIYPANWIAEEFLDASGTFLQFFFVLALVFFVAVRLTKSGLLNEQQKPFANKLYKWLWKIHIPVAVIGFVGVIVHGVVAFIYKNPFSYNGFNLGFIFTNHFSGLIAATLLLTVLISGILRKKKKSIWPHLILSLAFVIAYLIHG